MNKLIQKITEASLSRILRHTEDQPWAILTSWRDVNAPEVNQSNFKALKSAIRSLGLGFIPLKGKWKDEDTGGIVSEPSLFVPGLGSGAAHKLGNKYDQDAVLVGEPGKVWLIFQSGGTETLGKRLSVQDANSIFSEFKGRKFVFESLEIVPNSFVGALTKKLTGLPVEVVDGALQQVANGADMDAVLEQLRAARRDGGT